LIQTRNITHLSSSWLTIPIPSHIHQALLDKFKANPLLLTRDGA
jgi:hypothetical protein